MKKTIIVMPVANESATMKDVIERILSLPYDNLLLYAVIDSFSTDNTEEILRSYEDTGRVKTIFHEGSTGVISCYLYGYKCALEDGADQIIEMDAGGSHLPEEIPQFIDNLEAGYECVWGSRFVEGGSMNTAPLYRRILSGGGTALANLVLGTSLKDMTSGFEGFKREILEQFNFDAFLSQGHIYQTEMRFYCRNRKSIEVPIHYLAGKTSLKFKSVTEAFKVLGNLKKNESKVFKI